MAETETIVTNLQRILAVDVISGKGIAIRFLAADDNEHLMQVLTDEAHALADMLAIALSRRPAD